MNTESTSESVINPRIIVRGIHLQLTPALRQAAIDKAARLFRHENQIVRVRIHLDCNPAGEVGKKFTAQGQLEIGGPDLVATVATDDAYKALDLLMDKLDGLLRRRHGRRVNTRNDPEPEEVSMSRVA